MQPIILFDYDLSRSQTVPLRLLEGYRGYLQIDGYEGYSAVGSQHLEDGRLSIDNNVKANGHEPYYYLRHLFTELPKATSLAAIEALLPFNIKPDQLSRSLG